MQKQKEINKCNKTSKQTIFIAFIFMHNKLFGITNCYQFQNKLLKDLISKLRDREINNSMTPQTLHGAFKVKRIQFYD